MYAQGLQLLDAPGRKALLETGLSNEAADGLLLGGIYLNGRGGGDNLKNLEKSSGIYATIQRMNEGLLAKLYPVSYNKHELEQMEEVRLQGFQIFKMWTNFYEKRGYSLKDAKAFAPEKFKIFMAEAFDELEDQSPSNHIEKENKQEAKHLKSIKNVDTADGVVLA